MCLLNGKGLKKPTYFVLNNHFSSPMSWQHFVLVFLTVTVYDHDLYFPFFIFCFFLNAINPCDSKSTFSVQIAAVNFFNHTKGEKNHQEKMYQHLLPDNSVLEGISFRAH